MIRPKRVRTHQCLFFNTSHHREYGIRFLSTYAQRCSNVIRKTIKPELLKGVASIFGPSNAQEVIRRMYTKIEVAGIDPAVQACRLEKPIALKCSGTRITQHSKAPRQPASFTKKHAGVKLICRSRGISIAYFMKTYFLRKSSKAY